MTHFRHHEQFTTPFEGLGGESWAHHAAAEAYTRGAHFPRHHHDAARGLPELGFHSGRHHWEQPEGGHHWRSHHRGRIGRSLGGDPEAGPQSYYPQNAGFPGFGKQPGRYGRQREGFNGNGQYTPQDNGWGWGQPQQQEQPFAWGQPQRQHRERWGQPEAPDSPGGPREARQRYNGRTEGGLTPGQKAFADEFSRQTGLDRGVVGHWLLQEESGRAAQNREAQGNMNWLNVGYTDHGHRGTGNQFWYGDPVKAADATAAWMKGELHVPGFGSASHGIRRIQEAANLPPSEQMGAIARSGWASSHYGYQYASNHRAHDNYYASHYRHYHHSSWRFS